LSFARTPISLFIALTGEPGYLRFTLHVNVVKALEDLNYNTLAVIRENIINREMV